MEPSVESEEWASRADHVSDGSSDGPHGPGGPGRIDVGNTPGLIDIPTLDYGRGASATRARHPRYETRVGAWVDRGA
ncbi:hypothetical protein GCM10025883_32070 [Mobilicoccus caccae]|uniref:Uncharacterized protein n=1 Tax=Mobilicoccus caccae TaxID=1859295 RepID=A0ABQ6IVJ1_9MICO|nr:hypothetical protein GCM10025883_32070 [Mobilicoccus caccae]